MRLGLAIVIIGAGIAALAYAAMARQVDVLVPTQTTVVRILPPDPQAPQPRSLFPFRRPEPPKPKRITETVIQDRPQRDHEPIIVRDVTVGGLLRTAEGQLRRTYAQGQAGPALCPT